VVELEDQWPATSCCRARRPKPWQEADWLFRTSPTTPERSLPVTLIVESQERILVDTCIGNDKDRAAFPQWHHLSLPFLKALDDAAARGSRSIRHARTYTSTTSLEHDARQGQMGADVPQREVPDRRHERTPSRQEDPSSRSRSMTRCAR
jgi:hypothetical protein